MGRRCGERCNGGLVVMVCGGGGRQGWRPQCVVVAITSARVMATARGGVAKVGLLEMHGSFECLGKMN